MKKLIFLFAIVISACMVNAQNSKVQSAINYIKPGYYDLAKAKEAIDLASVHEKTIGKAKTWKVRGQVYQAIGQSKEESDKALSSNPLGEALAAYQKATELDTKGTYKNEIILQLTTLSGLFINQGIECFNTKDYECAQNSFEGALNVDAISDPERIDTMIIFNVAIAADRAGNNEKAIEYYQKTIDLRYEGSKVFNFIANIQLAAGDTVAYLETLKSGVQTYPEDNSVIMVELINYYLTSGQSDLALGYLDQAIDKDPTNATFYFARGTLYDNLKDEENAKLSYEKAVELKPDYFDAYYNLGALYFNKGADMLKEANNIPPNEQAKYDEAVKLALVELEKALPYLEAAHEIKPEEQSTMLTLKEIYFKLRNDKPEYMTRYTEINEALKVQ